MNSRKMWLLIIMMLFNHYICNIYFKPSDKFCFENDHFWGESQ